MFEERLDRYMIRWASKLLLVEHVDGEVRVSHLSPDVVRRITRAKWDARPSLAPFPGMLTARSGTGCPPVERLPGVVPRSPVLRNGRRVRYAPLDGRV
jgi:hypothetical protein